MPDKASVLKLDEALIVGACEVRKFPDVTLLRKTNELIDADPNGWKWD